MTREEYNKRLNWLFPKEEDIKYPARIIIRCKLEENFNHHNIQVVKKMCISKMHQLIGIDGKKKTLKLKGKRGIVMKNDYIYVKLCL